MGKKAAVDFSAGGLRTAPLVADNAFNWRVFDANAQAYLRKRIAPGVFADICAAALRSPLAVPYGHTIYKYRYLALMEEERYYEAFLDAEVMGGVFRDELNHQQMLCSVYLKRHNFDRALDCVNKLLAFARRNGLDMVDLLGQRAELLRFMAKIKTFTAPDFCRKIERDGEEAQRLYSGLPVIVKGKALFALNEETRHPFLVFNLDDKDNETGFKRIYGQTAPCEIPFLQGLVPHTIITMLGYFLGALEDQLLFSPCYLLD